MLNNKLHFSEKKKNLLDLKRSPLFPLELCIVCQGRNWVGLRNYQNVWANIQVGYHTTKTTQQNNLY